jgi:MGT family glycosyltransferase
MRLLAYTSPARGHVYPAVPILRALAARGHGVHACAMAGELDRLDSLGIEASAIDPAIEAIQIADWRERSFQGAARSVLRTFAERSQLEAPDLTRAIERHDPDALLIDVNTWGAAAVAEASGRAWAVYSPYLLPLRSRDAPPFGLGLRPRRGPLGALRDAVVRRAGDSLFKRTAGGSLNRLRSDRGLDQIGSFDELLRRAPLLLSLTAAGFEYPRRDWPASVRLVGPMNWNPSEMAAEPPRWLAELGDPLVLVTCSTELQDDRRLIQAALEGLPAKDMSVIATSAAHDPREFEQGPRSRVERFVPHDAILERAACVVCHGGLGITQKALSAGIPVVVVPFGRDQLETARRVELARAGVRLSPRKLTPKRLAGAVEAAIALAPGAQRIAREFASAGGPRAAAEAIERLWSAAGGDFVGDKIRP